MLRDLKNKIKQTCLTLGMWCWEFFMRGRNQGKQGWHQPGHREQVAKAISQAGGRPGRPLQPCPLHPAQGTAAAQCHVPATELRPAAQHLPPPRVPQLLPDALSPAREGYKGAPGGWIPGRRETRQLVPMLFSQTPVFPQRLNFSCAPKILDNH